MTNTPLSSCCGAAVIKLLPNACSNPLCPMVERRIAREMCPCRIAAQNELEDNLKTPVGQKDTIPNLGCKFCHYVFSLVEGVEYKDHLWRFHRDDLQEDLNKIVHEINRIEKMPQ